jgi:ABC-type sugar transport system substrate-binding protein
VAPVAESSTAPKANDKLDTKVYVGVSIRTLTNPYLVTIKEGAEMFCKYLTIIGQDYELQVLSCEGSNEKQVNDIKAFVAKANGNAILYVDPNEAAIAPAIADVCEEAGAYMVTAWNKPDDVSPMDYTKWVAHHSPDDKISGHAISIEMFKAFKTANKGKILAVQGMLGNTAATNRFEGLKQALAENPDVKLVEEQTGNWDTQEALKIVETWLSKYDDIDGIWCANDNMAIGAAQALKAKGLNGKIKVVGVDCVDDAVIMVKNGDMTATVASNGWLQGGYSLAIAYAAWNGSIDVKALPESQRLFNTEGLLVTSNTVADYEAKFIKSKPNYDFSKPFDCVYPKK